MKRRRRKRSDKEFADLTQEIDLDKFQASVNAKLKCRKFVQN